MPTYDYNCKECNHIFEEVNTIVQRNIPTERGCPKCNTIGSVIIKVGAPLIGDPVSLGLTKPHPAFNARLKEIKKNYSKAGVDIQSKYGN